MPVLSAPAEVSLKNILIAAELHGSNFDGSTIGPFAKPGKSLASGEVPVRNSDQFSL